MIGVVRDAARHLAVVFGLDVHVFCVEEGGVQGAGDRGAGNAMLISGTAGPTRQTTPGGAPGEAECTICDPALRGHVPSTDPGRTHRFAAYQAERLGGSYVYLCPFGLLHLAAPVVFDERLAYALVCGPAVLDAIDDEVITAATGALPASLLSKDAVAAWLHSVPRKSPGEAQSLSYLLSRVALSLCDAAGVAYLRRASEQSRATETTEYLDYLSTMAGSGDGVYPVELDRRLTDCVAQGDRAGALAELDQIEAAVRSYGSDVEAARARILELVVLLSRAAIAGGADVEQVFGLEYGFLSRLRALDSVESLVAWLRRVLARFTDLVFDLRHLRYSAHLSKLLRYVHDNFRDEVSLDGAAKAVGLSSGYLSRILKSELHTSFKAYLARVRLQEARRLLRSTTLPVGEVAYRCGYPDHSYFTAVFRKATGRSPSEFRQSVGG